MKKIKLIALPLVASLSLGAAACTVHADKAPEITGVDDRICAVGELYDLIDGIAALDKEDGDITPKLKITVDGEEVDGFYTSFDYEDDYEVKYKVTDSRGHITEETAIISAVEREAYKSFDLVKLDGFKVKTAGAAKCSQSVVGGGADGKLILKTSGAQAAGDVVLTRTYTLTSGTEYTFKYYLKSDVAGTAKAKVGNGETTDLSVTAGNNVLTFTYDVPADAEHASINADVQILLGGLGDAQIEFDKAEAQHTGALSQAVVLETGNNVKGRFDSPAAGDASASSDGKSATLNVTAAHPSQMYCGGMFIDTGIKPLSGKSYTVSFDLTAANDEPFEVIIQNKQWDETKYKTQSINSEADYHQEITVTPNILNANGLWIYVQSGTHVNEITISNITVSSAETQSVTETFTCKKFIRRRTQLRAVG